MTWIPALSAPVALPEVSLRSVPTVFPRFPRRPPPTPLPPPSCKAANRPSQTTETTETSSSTKERLTNSSTDRSKTEALQDVADSSNQGVDNTVKTRHIGRRCNRALG